MAEIFLKTLPFFLLIGTGWAAAYSRFFPAEATAWLTKFVFYFALSAMLFRFAAALDVQRLFDARFFWAYLSATAAVWAVAMTVARWRKLPLADAAMEAHTAITGNTGFLGVPMLVVLLGQAAIGPVMMVLTIDLVIFSALLTLLVTAARQGRTAVAALGPLVMGIVGNPMIVSMVAGLIWAAFRLPMPAPVAEFLELLGAAATPGALFAIGASLAGRSAQRMGPALWISGVKLVLHPLAVGIAALMIFDVDAYAAGVMIAAASLPVAGNVYILAQHFGVAAQRVSTAILVSTAASIATVPAVIHWITTR
ncbi:AEC family transporter [Paracoccus shanxieyensis]|uniref:AEC family transporter n=1 Tax=Paracoccus shanxieyensis TaxID=2675752 RepID=A0A6L6IWK0_9RHOB|nr:AEC family transporter [Paracoccus shanxieyensis]MTH62974.1 AEC family transporter [Paracoccus shanxieyensis]MTH85942.1 AEC family transporter [Paracoccus shanxieyensis]